MTSIFSKKEKMLELIAFASLKYNEEPINLSNILAEKSRIERIAEQDYLNTQDQEYNEFIISWLKINGNDIVYSDRFLGDVSIPDDSHDTNVNNFMR